MISAERQKRIRDLRRRVWWEQSRQMLGKPAAPFQAHSSTSQAAAQSIASHTARQRQRVLEFLQQRGGQGATDQEIEHALEMAGSSVRPRRGELVKLGRVFDSGMERPTVAGRNAVIWMAKGKPGVELRDERLNG